MKRYLPILLCLLLGFATNASAWTVLSSACADDFGGTSAATTAAIDTTGADLIVGYAGQFAQFTHVIEDSASNTITVLDYHGIDSMEYALWYIASPTTSATHTFTSTNTVGAAEAAICVMAVSGSHATPFDVQNGAAAAPSTSLQTGSITPSTSGQLIITGGHTGSLDNWPTTPVDSGFTIQDRSGLGHIEIAIGYLVQGAAAAVNPTWTADLENSRNIVAIASFKAAAGAAGSRRVIIVQ